MRKFRYIIVAYFCCNAIVFSTLAQPVISTQATQSARDKTYRNIVKNSIQKNLSLPAGAATEENYTDAFRAMLFLHYQDAWTKNKLDELTKPGYTSGEMLSLSILEYLQGMNLRGYEPFALQILDTIREPALAIASLAYLQYAKQALLVFKRQMQSYSDDPRVRDIMAGFQQSDIPKKTDLNPFFQKSYLPGKTLMIILVRKNRDWPGLCLLRDSTGQWTHDSLGFLWQVPVLARSLSNMPSVLRNGNTPQGIFRMDGFARSASSFIGPSDNVQLTLPFEYRAGHFFQQTILPDSAWSIQAYAQLLPGSLRSDSALYQSYRAGEAGRREIILHGSTVDPGWYRHQKYIPFTPTQGCITTTESWDPQTGVRGQSGMYLVTQKLKTLGGARGYALVIETGEQEGAVSPREAETYILQSGNGF